jgi:hypothetical protein
MIRAKPGLEDTQGALQVGARGVVVVHILEQQAQIVEASGGVGVLGA